jgi:predicted metal-dependent hydrolase
LTLLGAVVAVHCVTIKRISVRDQSSRWGSCSNARVLSFSWRLILAPPFVLDYLAAHEVAHLVELNRSPSSGGC